MEVRRASHAHQVPQVGCPHNDPVMIARHVKSKPIGDRLLFIEKKKFNFKDKV